LSFGSSDKKSKIRRVAASNAPLIEATVSYQMEEAFAGPSSQIAGAIMLRMKERLRKSMHGEDFCFGAGEFEAQEPFTRTVAAVEAGLELPLPGGL